MSIELELARPQDAIAATDTALVDVIDGLLSQGVVIRGEIWLTVADVELVFLGLDVVLATPEKMKRGTM